MRFESDAELLGRFAATGDERAFSALVERHAGMVLGVAWRRAGDRSSAEEIAQNVFAVLARKSRSLPGRNLAGWLHRATVLEASNASRKAARYQHALQQLGHEMKTMSSAGDPAWGELSPHLDEAMSRLPEEARHLVVMHYFERRSISEIAADCGKGADACRKRLQRAIQVLEALLRKRGLLRSGTGLTILLEAQQFSVSPASAAAIAAAALNAGPGLTIANLIGHTFSVMNIATIIKTSAVAIVIAAIPMTILWQQNARLEAKARRLETMAQASAAPPNIRLGSSSAAGPSEISAEAIVRAAPVEPQPPDAAGQSLEAILERAKEKSKRRAAMQFTRICLNLPDLNPEQKDRIKEALETRGSAALTEMLGAFQSGAVARGLQNHESLSDQEKAVLAAIDPRKTAAVSVDDELKSILTADQYARHMDAQQARRVSDAEDAATDTLKFIGRSFDLSADQKDRIFQQLAHYDLSPKEAAAAQPTDVFPLIGSHEDARDQIIRANLTPAQVEVFNQLRAAERSALKQEMMQFYSAPKAAQRMRP